MTSAITIISPNWLEENINEKADQSLTEHGVDYSQRTIGAYRYMGAIRNFFRFGKEAGFVPRPALTEFDKNLTIGIGALGFPRLPSVTSDAIKSISALSQGDDGVSFSRKAVKAVRDLMDAISAYGFCSVFITGNPVVRTVAQSTEFVTDLADLQISTSDYSKASELEEIATGDAKVALGHSKNYYFLRIVKAVVSIACGILGFAMLITGAALLPALALMTLFLASTLIAITRDMYKETGKFKVINFDKEVRLALG